MTKKPSPKKRAPARCPMCGKPHVDERARPFCSARCQLLDLGQWLGERYAVAGDEVAVLDDGDA